MKQFFLDTGYVIALESSDDQYHAVALAHWQLTEGSRKLLTTSLVFAEVIAFINGRGRYDKAVRVGRRLLEDPDIELIHVNEDLFQAGWDYLKNHRDKRYSLTDCISFVVMQDRGCKQTWTTGTSSRPGSIGYQRCDGPIDRRFSYSGASTRTPDTAPRRSRSAPALRVLPRRDRRRGRGGEPRTAASRRVPSSDRATRRSGPSAHRRRRPSPCRCCQFRSQRHAVRR